jgi:hypothetical protein
LKDPSQPQWLLRFPMVKATLRAMDALTEFAAKKFPEKNYQLDYYGIAGASKVRTSFSVDSSGYTMPFLLVPISPGYVHNLILTW